MLSLTAAIFEAPVGISSESSDREGFGYRCLPSHWWRSGPKRLAQHSLIPFSGASTAWRNLFALKDRSHRLTPCSQTLNSDAHGRAFSLTKHDHRFRGAQLAGLCRLAPWVCDRQ